MWLRLRQLQRPHIALPGHVRCLAGLLGDDDDDDVIILRPVAKRQHSHSHSHGSLQIADNQGCSLLEYLIPCSILIMIISITVVLLITNRVI